MTFRRTWTLALIGLCFSGESNAQISTYESLGNAKFNMAIDIQRKEVRLGGLVEEARFCDSSEAFHCFETTALAFHVPRKITADSWKSGELVYTIVGRETLHILGTPIAVMRISVNASVGNLVFIYSEKRGLIALGLGSDDKPQLLLLRERVGFASQCP